MKFILFCLVLVILSGCSDNATVIYYDKKEKNPNCLHLVVFPPDPLISKTLTHLYHFQNECPYELQVSKKGGIVCNSNQNADKKALSNFPTGYIRMDLYKNHKAIYSYYKDLNNKISKDDIQSAFKRFQRDILRKDQR